MTELEEQLKLEIRHAEIAKHTSDQTAILLQIRIGNAEAQLNSISVLLDSVQGQLDLERRENARLQQYRDSAVRLQDVAEHWMKHAKDLTVHYTTAIELLRLCKNDKESPDQISRSDRIVQFLESIEAPKTISLASLLGMDRRDGA